MLILGIDPGSRHTGYGLIDATGGKIRAVAQGRISIPAGRPLPARLCQLTHELNLLLDRWQPNAAALETAFHGRNSRSLIVLAQARGCLLATLAARDLEIREYSPAEIKMAVAGHGRADKQEVGKMVGLHLALGKQVLSADASDALASAICYAHRVRIDRLSELE